MSIVRIGGPGGIFTRTSRDSHENDPPEQKEKVNMATKLYVGNLSFSISEGELRQLFEPFGTVASCNLIMDRMTDRPRGFAFVEMSSPAEAAKAIEALNGKEAGGRALVVNEAKPREDRPRGGGGFGGGNGGGYGGGGNGGGRRNRY